VGGVADNLQAAQPVADGEYGAGLKSQQVEKELAEQAAALARADEMQRSRQRIVSAQESLRKEIAQQLHGSVQNVSFSLC